MLSRLSARNCMCYTLRRLANRHVDTEESQGRDCQQFFCKVGNGLLARSPSNAGCC